MIVDRLDESGVDVITVDVADWNLTTPEMRFGWKWPTRDEDGAYLCKVCPAIIQQQFDAVPKEHRHNLANAILAYLQMYVVFYDEHTEVGDRVAAAEAWIRERAVGSLDLLSAAQLSVLDQT